MARKRKSDRSRDDMIKRYARNIPTELRTMLLPKTAQERFKFVRRISALHMREEERNYVIELQHRFGLPLRPNESVKRTMIRARLKVLHKVKTAHQFDDHPLRHRRLPIDPLE
jgi:hypothetical protein